VRKYPRVELHATEFSGRSFQLDSGFSDQMGTLKNTAGTKVIDKKKKKIFLLWIRRFSAREARPGKRHTRPF